MTRPAHSTNPDAPAWRKPAIIGGVVALAVVAGILFALVLARGPQTASNDPSPSPSPLPSATASPSHDPSPSEEPAPSETPGTPAEPSEEADDPYVDPVVANPDGVLPGGAVVRVLVDGLRVRDHAILASEVRATVNRGDLLIVGPTFEYGAFGPATESGFTWYPVGVLGRDELPEPGGEPLAIAERGFVAIGDGDSAWLELVDPRCTDDEPTLQHLSSLTEWERLACYGDRQLTVEGVFGCGFCLFEQPGEYTPEWLAYTVYDDYLSVEPQDRFGPLTLRWSPDGPERPSTDGVAPILRVTGHFDDPAATGCTITYFSQFGDSDAVDASSSELYCRSQFVVDSYEVIGEDEDFPFES